MRKFYLWFENDFFYTIICNIKKANNSAHHDIILPAIVSGHILNIPVSAKASAKLSPDKKIQSQLKVSKQQDAKNVELLIWLYLGQQKREKRYYNNVLFLDGSGCCNGLALDQLILTKKHFKFNFMNWPKGFFKKKNWNFF